MVAPGQQGAYPTIGDAVREAPDGATISVADGRYEETFDLVGRSLTLRAAPGATVRLDCTGAAWTALHGLGRNPETAELRTLTAEEVAVATS